MGSKWFVKTFGILLLVHHFWFFMLEMFKLNEVLYVFQKTGLSALISFLISVFLQFLFLRKPKRNEA
jgi:predicted acyltransferase